MKMEAESGTREPQAKGAWSPQELEEEKRSPQEPSEGPGPADTWVPDF